MEQMTIEVEKREAIGKGPNRRARARGQVPGVVYGAGRDTMPIQIDRKSLVDLLKKGGGENTVFLLKLTGTDKTRHAMIREMQLHPVSRQILHVDFQRILMTEKVKVQVPIALVGTAFGVKNEDAMLDFVTRQVQVECLPGDIPHHIDLDVTELHVNQHIEAKQLTLPANVVLAEEPDRVIVACSHVRLVEEPVAAEAAAEELIEAQPVEPELIKRGKAVEEEAEEKPEKREKK